MSVPNHPHRFSIRQVSSPEVRQSSSIVIRGNPVSYTDATSLLRPPCTDLGVNSLHRSVPVGLGLGDTVSVSCFRSKPPNQFPCSISRRVILSTRRFSSVLRLTLGGLVVAVMRAKKPYQFPRPTSRTQTSPRKIVNSRGVVL